MATEVEIKAPGVALSDINKPLAIRSFSGISHSPERRAEQEQQNYVRAMNVAWEAISKRAESPGQKEIARKEFNRFKDGYLERKNTLLQQQSGLFSSFIAGPSNFPTERMRKKNEAFDKKEAAFFEWQERTLKRSMDTVQPSKSGRISSDNPDATELLQQKIDRAKARQERFKTINAIVRTKADDSTKIKRLIAETETTEAQAEKLLEPGFGAPKGGIPAFELTTNNANIKRMEARISGIKKEETRRSDTVESRDFDDGKIVENADNNRLQIFFNEKPDADTRTKLKQRGFRWAPSEANPFQVGGRGAWQRQLNQSARNAANEILGIKADAVREKTMPTSALTEAQELKLFDLLGPRADLILRKENRPSLGLTAENFDTNLKSAQKLQEQDGSKFLEVKHLAQAAQEARGSISFDALRLSDVRNVVKYLKTINASRQLAAQRKTEASKAKTKDAEALLEKIPGGLSTVNRIDDALAKKRQERISPEKRRLFKQAEEGLKELQKPIIRQPSISFRAAEARFERKTAGTGRSKQRNPALDEQRQAKVVAPAVAKTEEDLKLQRRWFKNPNQLDFEGVDTKKEKPKARIKSSKL